MTRHLITAAPGPAHPAKNAAGPGLPTQPATDSKGRTSMVGKARQVIGATAARFAAAIDDEVVSYTPRELNRLIDTAASREVAARLRERAAWHRAQARADRDALAEQGYHAAGRTSLRAGWHTAEADRLEDAATRELALLERGERA